MPQAATGVLATVNNGVSIRSLVKELRCFSLDIWEDDQILRNHFLLIID